MDLPLILLTIGVVCVILSFFFNRSSKSQEEELENISISLHQETNLLKKRLKAVEEELMIGALPDLPAAGKTGRKPVHEIIVNQILSLHAQGYPIEDISARSSLPPAEVIDVLQQKGARV